MREGKRIDDVVGRRREKGGGMEGKSGEVGTSGRAAALGLVVGTGNVKAAGWGKMGSREIGSWGRKIREGDVRFGEPWRQGAICGR